LGDRLKKIYYTDISNIKCEQINLSLVSDDKLEKVSILKDEKKQVQSLSGYLLLKFILKGLGINIKDYEFKYDLNNKPYLKNLTLKFNISHSGNIVCCIVEDSEVGVDCEYIDLTRDLSKITKYSFTCEENAEFLKLDEKEKVYYFYQKWVMKEAYFKMMGLGLTKEFKNTNLNYPVFKISDTLNNQYYISASITDVSLQEVCFNKINE
jgi:4'-phosphopantetheinyl transferase